MGISYPFECLKRAWARREEKDARNRGNRIEEGAFGMLVLDSTGCTGYARSVWVYTRELEVRLLFGGEAMRHEGKE